MFEIEDFFGMGFEEEPGLTNDLGQGAGEPEGGGWGSFLLGGAIGSVMGAVSQTSERSCHPAVFEPFSSEEKIFLRQIWRFEEEMDKAQEQDDVERMVLLLNGFVGCMHGPWKDHFPGNEDYCPTEKFNAEIDNLVLPVLQKAASFSEDELNARLTPEQFKRIDGRNMTLNPDDWTFSLK